MPDDVPPRFCGLPWGPSVWWGISLSAVFSLQYFFTAPANTQFLVDITGDSDQANWWATYSDLALMVPLFRTFEPSDDRSVQRGGLGRPLAPPQLLAAVLAVKLLPKTTQGLWCNVLRMF